jgi:hypothetical protein
MTITFMSEHGCANVTFSNVNAMNLLRLLGLPAEPDGEMAGQVLDRTIRTLLSLVNRGPQTRAAATVAPSVTKSPGHATLIECGADDASVLRRMSALLTVLVQAQVDGSPVVWG